jgi:RNA polymerase sigma factor (sigma-70 family)
VIRANIDHHRRERRHRDPRPELFDDQVIGGPDRELVDVLAALPDAQRVVITLRFWAGMTFTEIAEATGSRVGTVKSRARRGLAAMREVLEP